MKAVTSFVCFAILAFPALAQQPAQSEPGSVVIDGKRVPTRVTPPTSSDLPVVIIRHGMPAANESAEETKEGQPGLSRKYYGDQRRWRVREYSYGGRTRYHLPYEEQRGCYLLPHGVYGVDPWGIQWALDEAYTSGRLDERYYSRRIEAEEWSAERTARLLTAHGKALQDGLDRLKSGEFSRAVASRRALDLQPKLACVDLSLDQYYPPGTTLESIAKTLDSWLRTIEATGELKFLQGYVEYQRGNNDSAHAAFVQAAAELPSDRITQDLLSLTRPAVKTAVQSQQPR
ncbi:MAG: hypothetical protein HZB38_07520 [Planctomycetes bacterium]|nr:hypothetical protein [Planctomycetota bacterium]